MNIRTKGAGGEREIAKILNGVVLQVVRDFELRGESIVGKVPNIQRNTLQSHQGGFDLTDTLDLAIEIKRQELLNVTAWWQQAVKQADKESKVPVLLYRKNHKGWICVTYAYLKIDGNKVIKVMCELKFDDFLDFFRQKLIVHLRSQ